MLLARWSQVLNRLVTIPSDEDAARLVDELASGWQPRMLAFVDAHAMNSALGDFEFYRALCGADVLLRDGSGMAMLFRMLGGEPGLDMNGADFIPRLLEAYRGRRVALWGAREKWLVAAAARCAGEYGVEIVSCESGFLAPAQYCDAMRRTRPELIVLGMPRQASVARLLRATAAGAPLIVCGGATIDRLGGKVERAPRRVRRSGMEWACRLVCEPCRLFQRYVIGKPMFMLRAWRCRAAWGR